jgi:hypothetical protein
MDLHQFQVTYHPQEDRLLLRLSFKDEVADLHEIRAWITRRMVRQLWPNLRQALETQVTLDQPGAAHAKSDLVSMAYQESVSALTAGGNFNVVYDAQAAHFPLGEQPLLLNTVQMTMARGLPIKVNFLPLEGQGFDLQFSTILLHGLCTMLQSAVAQSEWDMNLVLPGADEVLLTGESAQRVLN